MTTTTSLKVQVFDPSTVELTFEYHRGMNRMRVADPANPDKTLAVLTDEGVYGLLPKAPAGHLVVSNEVELGQGRVVKGLANVLAHAGLGVVVRESRDGVLGGTYSVVKMLPIPGERVRITGVMPKDPAPLAVGLEGTVTGTHGPVRQIHVDWDDGSTLILLTTDPFEVLTS